MNVEFSRHARNRMRRHRLTQEQIRSVIEQPQWQQIEPGTHFHIAWVRFQDAYLKVVYAEEEDTKWS